MKWEGGAWVFMLWMLIFAGLYATISRFWHMRAIVADSNGYSLSLSLSHSSIAESVRANSLHTCIP